jgi:hypothetical protein
VSGNQIKIGKFGCASSLIYIAKLEKELEKWLYKIKFRLKLMKLDPIYTNWLSQKVSSQDIINTIEKNSYHVITEHDQVLKPGTKHMDRFSFRLRK